ncbi:MAG: hypothetical protein ACK4UN_13830 [Limisphaerales bacterium]
MIDSQSTHHRWKFFRAGGLEQVCLEKGSDLETLAELDQKLWVALSSPSKGLEFDSKTLELIDTDKDGRIRVPEIIAAVNWAVAHLRNPDELLHPKDAFPLSSIDDSTESGAKLLQGARRILANLGKTDGSISVADISDTSRIFAQTRFNGDGVVPADAATDPAVQKVIEEIIGTIGSINDRSGKPGLNTSNLEAFFAQAKAFVDWQATGEKTPEISLLGSVTTDAFYALSAVRQKLDDYFARCDVAAFDSRATTPLNRSESEFSLMAVKDLTPDAEEIRCLPLALVTGRRALPLDGQLNPAWTPAMENFKRKVVTPLLGEGRELRQEDWEQLKSKFAPHGRWLSDKPDTPVQKLGVARLREILASDALGKIRALIEEDLRLQTEYNQIAELERLVRYYRDLQVLLRNFVNFADFYNPGNAAVFKTGTLFIDGRSCELSVSVEDIGKHSTLSEGSGIFLIYCEITRLSTGQKRNICAAVTSGFGETLWVGRNGIFYDRAGNDWDATIVKVVEHQLSLKEAFWSPWRKISKMISDQVNKLLAAREAAALSAAGKRVEDVGQRPPTPVPVTNSGAAMASSVAAIGIAVGLLGTAIGGLMEFVKDATLLNIILGVLCVIAAVSLPSVLIAYFKLRKRDIAPILNASGWAINRRIRLTLKLGRMLTREPKLPEGSERIVGDPYAEGNGRRNFWLVVFIVMATGLLWYLGRFDPILPVDARSTTVLGTNAPAAAKMPVQSPFPVQQP